MSAKEKSKLKDMCNEDLFAALDEHTKRVIARDMENVYGERADLTNPENPWVFELRKR